MTKKYEIEKVDDVINAMLGIAVENTAIANTLLKAKGHKDFIARAYRQKALFTILLLKELEFIDSSTYLTMVDNLDKEFKAAKLKAEKEGQM